MAIRSNYRFRGRIKFKGDFATYHCMSRIVGGQGLLRRREMEVFRRMMRRQAAFCGMEILTYAIMSNHFHLLVRVGPRGDLNDFELIERVRALYGDMEATAAKNLLESEREGPALRERLLSRMGDVSVFLKELKQRFSIWYNHAHERFGTLWAERFKSVLVEGREHALVTVAAYIDLNAVRAGICDDPKDYRFCGYGEASAGDAVARKGLQKIFDKEEWFEAQRAYRLILFAKGIYGGPGKGRISEEALREVYRQNGELPLADMLRCRVRYFADGMVLGSAEFVEGVYRSVKDRYWTKRKSGAYSIAENRSEGLFTLNRMRGRRLG